MNTTFNVLRAILLAVIIAVPLTASVIRADEIKALRPEIEQLAQTVSDKIQAGADKLGLTNEQREKIGEIRASHAEQCKALRAERRSLLQEELKSISSILTQEQRDKVKEFAEDHIEQAEQSGTAGLPRFAAVRDTLAERMEAAADKLGLTSDQRKQIVKAVANQAEQHAALKRKCREAIEGEFKAIAAILTPEQREKARDAIELRVLRAVAASSIADRLEADADKLNLSAEQRQKVAKTHAQFASQYRELRSDRRELLEQELKSLAAILTPEQRDKVKDFCEDRVVVVEVRTAARDAADGEAALRETISERLEAVADRLGLTAEQRTKIRGVADSMAEKFKAQRERRTALRAEEMKALSEILTPEQREKVKHLVEERT